jgi:hypothetical protein
MCMNDSRRGFGLDIGFIDHFNIQLVITLNYSAIANLRTLQITIAHAKSFPACSVFISSCLVTASNNGYSSASVLKFSLNGGYLPTVLRVTLRLAVYRQSIRLGAKPLQTHDQYFFHLNTCGYSPYVTSSLMKGWVCRLQLLLALASTFSGPSPVGLMTIFHCLRFDIRWTRKARSPYLYPPVTGWPGYTPRHWVPISSPPTTRRATVEVFKPASTRILSNWNIYLKYRGGPKTEH